MNLWLKGGLITAALFIGFAVGWFVGSKLELRPPNVPVATAVLLAGVLGGPWATMALLGPSLLSFLLAMGLAGFSAGIVFWPMGRRQGEKEWL